MFKNDKYQDQSQGPIVTPRLWALQLYRYGLGGDNKLRTATTTTTTTTTTTVLPCECNRLQCSMLQTRAYYATLLLRHYRD